MATSDTAVRSGRVAQPQLPAPHVFDILPALHELLARVDAYNNQNLRGPDVEEQDALDDGVADIGSDYSDVQPLNPKDLPLATLEIKAKIRTALRELEKLPDMDRTIAEQSEELEELEVKIQKQREMLRGLAVVARQMQERVQIEGT